MFGILANEVSSHHETRFVAVMREASKVQKVTLFGLHVVILADEFGVVQHVELFASGQLSATDCACEAVQVKHFITGLANHVLWRDALSTASTFGTIASENMQTMNY